MGLSCGVVGASGFTGAELVRILVEHPALELAALSADRRAGAELGAVLPHVAGVADLPLLPADEVMGVAADVWFWCAPVPSPSPPRGDHVVVDLTDAHRGHADWTYGLTEWCRAEVATTTRVANPGCYPTAVLLALLPFARAGLVDSAPIVVDAISGISGAGRRESDATLFSVADGSAGAYGEVTHRHVPEMERALARVGGLDAPISFTPHLAPMARGLVATVRAPLAGPLGDRDARDLLRETYAGEPFVAVVDAWPQSKPAVGSNRAFLSARVDTRTGFLVASATLDNLGKGAAGQAVQNANVALGLDETAGLDRVGVWP